MAPKRHGSSYAAPLLGCAAALTYMLTHGAAFTYSPAPNAVTERLVSNAGYTASASIAREAYTTSSTGTYSSLQLTGIVAFAVVSAAQALRLRQTRSRRAAKRCVVECRAAPASFSDSRPLAMASVPVVAPGVSESTPAVTYTSPPLISCLVESESAPVMKVALPVQSAPQTYTAQTSASSRRPSAARFLGGSRRVGLRHARRAARTASRAAANDSAAHRAAGGRLQDRFHNQVVPLSYDASRVRTKMQIALRSQSRVRSGHNRETKTASSAAADTTKSSSVCVQIEWLESESKPRKCISLLKVT